jgi:hypothetical protein
MKTFAELKRNADSGNYYIEMVYRYGDEIPDRLKGIRQLVGSKTKAILIRTNDNKVSQLDIDNTNLIDISDNALIIYNSGFRELTNQEQEIMNIWKKIANEPDNQKQAETDLLTDGSTMFWKKKGFFTGLNAGYLLGHEKEKGEKYDFNTGKIRSDKVKGDKIMEYRIIKKDTPLFLKIA